MSYPKLNKRTGKYEIRWLEGGHHRQRTFTRKRDAQAAWNRIQRLRETGDLGMLSAGNETLGTSPTAGWSGRSRPARSRRRSPSATTAGSWTSTSTPTSADISSPSSAPV
jgi:hypothetical protein